MDEEQEQEEYIKPYEQDHIPVTSDQQLGQDILRTSARVSDPPLIKMQKVRRKVPVFGVKTILLKDGSTKDVEFIEAWEMQEWDIPIKVQPEYHELITDDIARAFLSREDYWIYLDIGEYCQTVRSFAKRYDLDLALHHNHWVDGCNQMVVGSGAVGGQRVKIAKANLSETTYKADTFQIMQQKKDNTRKKVLGIF